MIKRFANCARGAIAAMTALLGSVLIGVTGLGLEVAYWYTMKNGMQGAADAAVVSGAIAFAAGNTTGNAYADEAFAVAAANGWSGTTAMNNSCTPGSGIKVCWNSPPKYGNYTSNSSATEVVISNSISPLLAWAVGYTSLTGILAHAVVAPVNTNNGCLFALGSGNSIQVSGSSSATPPPPEMWLYGCNADGNGNIEVTDATVALNSFAIAGTVSTSSGGELLVFGPAGISNDTNVPSNPFSGLSIGTRPTSCANTNVSVSTNKTLSPGSYCGASALSITGGTVTLNSGVYYIEGGNFTVSGSATVTSATGGVTIVMTCAGATACSSSSTYGTISISNSATLNLTALTTGATAGILFFADPAQTTGSGGTSAATETFGSSSPSSVTGAFYFPAQTVALSGSGGLSSPTNCFEIVAYDIVVSGSGLNTLSDGCSGTGVSPFASSQLQLVE